MFYFWQWVCTCARGTNAESSGVEFDVYHRRAERGSGLGGPGGGDRPSLRVAARGAAACAAPRPNRTTPGAAAAIAGTSLPHCSSTFATPAPTSDRLPPPPIKWESGGLGRRRLAVSAWGGG